VKQFSSHREAASQKSLARVSEILPGAWRVSGIRDNSLEDFSPFTERTIKARSEATGHSLLLPDTEQVVDRRFTDNNNRVPYAFNPRHQLWGAEEHGHVIRHLLNELDLLKLPHGHVVNLSNWYNADSKQPENAVGFVSQPRERFVNLRSPSIFTRGIAQLLKPRASDINGVHGDNLRRTFGFPTRQVQDPLDDIDSLPASHFSNLLSAAFGSDARHHDPLNHEGSIGNHHGEGTHLIGLPAVRDHFMHELGHSDFFRRFNGDLPHPNTQWSEPGSHKMSDFVDEIGNYYQDCVARGTISSRLKRYSTYHQDTDLAEGNASYGVGFTPQVMKENYQQGPRWFLTKNMLDESDVNGTTTPLLDGIVNAAHCAKGSHNLQELYATHFASWMNPCSPVNEFTQRLATRFSWPDPHNKTGRSPVDVPVKTTEPLRIPEAPKAPEGLLTEYYRH